MSALKQWRATQKPAVRQADLAKLLETTQSHVSEIEKNEDAVSLETAAKIFSITGLRVGKLKGASDKQADAIAEAVANATPEEKFVA